MAWILKNRDIIQKPLSGAHEIGKAAQFVKGRKINLSQQIDFMNTALRAKNVSYSKTNKIHL